MYSAKVMGIHFKKAATYFRNFGLSAMLDLSIFAIILFFAKPIFGTGMAILMASVTARILSSLVNFRLNKVLFLGGNSKKRSYLIKYYSLWLGLLTSSASMIYIINDVFAINEVIAKTISDISLGIFSYQTQMRWVFRENSSKKTKGIYFRVVRKILACFMKREVMVDKKIFSKENVLVGHHQNFYGPVSCMLYLPDSVHFWVVSHLFTFKECFNMYYQHTFKKIIKLPKILAFIMAVLCGLFIPPLIKSAKAIPVYRESRKITKTLTQSIDLLNQGKQVMIFPDAEYDDDGQIMGEIYNGFMHLEKLYHRANKKHIGFVPIITDKKTGKIINSKALYFNDKTPYNVQKNILTNQIRDSMNLKYKDNTGLKTHSHMSEMKVKSTYRKR